MSQIELINKEVSLEIANEAVQKALLATTFKGLTIQSMKQAMVEGMMRGFKFKDFLEKNVYAIPFSGGYSLITSIDYARKVGMRSGVVGTSRPEFEEKDGKVVACTITIKRKIKEYVGEYSATVYFDEYNTKRNQWLTKPRTMIAKVAEMHALRKACPEELAQSYVEEEMHKDAAGVVNEIASDQYKVKLEEAKTEEEMRAVWSKIPAQAKVALKPLQLELKKKYENPKVSE